MTLRKESQAYTFTPPAVDTFCGVELSEEGITDSGEGLSVMERGGIPTDSSGHRGRLRQRFAAGGRNALADYELLELLLTYAIPRIDTKPLAKRLLAAHGSLHRVLSQSAEELQKTDGVGPAAAVFLTAIQATLTRSLEGEVEQQESIQGPEDIARFVRVHIGSKERECLMLICLNDANKLVHHTIVSEGSISRTPFYPRDILKPAILHNATRIIVVHNHPSGDAIPSDADHEMTRKLETLVDEFDIRLIDHLIATPRQTFSLKTGRLL